MPIGYRGNAPHRNMTYNIRGNCGCYHYCVGLPTQPPSFPPWPTGLLGASCLLKVIIEFIKGRLLASFVSSHTSPFFPSWKHWAHVAPFLPWPPPCPTSTLPRLPHSDGPQSQPQLPLCSLRSFSLPSPSGLLSGLTHICGLHLHLQGDDAPQPSPLASSRLEGLTSCGAFSRSISLPSPLHLSQTELGVWNRSFIFCPFCVPTCEQGPSPSATILIDITVFILKNPSNYTKEPMLSAENLENT